MTAPSHAEAEAHLTQADPALGHVIARVGPATLAPSGHTPFESLVRAIVYQQLSGKAAGTIHGRLIARMGEGVPTPDGLDALTDDELRAVGLSWPKVSYMRALSGHFRSAAPPEDWSDWDDEAVIAALTSIKGIGRWTAQMFLMFTLSRPDVLPEADLGIQKGLQRLDGLVAVPKPKELIARAEVWRPFRTIASWYLWRSLELPPEP